MTESSHKSSSSRRQEVEIIPFDYEILMDKINHPCLKTVTDRLNLRIGFTGKSQIEIANQLGVSQPKIQRELTGELPKKPKILFKRLIDYARVLECTPEYLLGIVDSPNDIALTPNGCHMWGNLFKSFPDRFRQKILDAYDVKIDKGLLTISKNVPKQKIFDTSFYYEKKPISFSIDTLKELTSKQSITKTITDEGIYFIDNNSQDVKFMYSKDTSQSIYQIIRPQFHHLLPGEFLEDSHIDKIFDISAWGLLNLLTITPDIIDHVQYILKTLWSIQENGIESFKDTCQYFLKHRRLFDEFNAYCATHPSKKSQDDLIAYMQKLSHNK